MKTIEELNEEITKINSQILALKRKQLYKTITDEEETDLERLNKYAMVVEERLDQLREELN